VRFPDSVTVLRRAAADEYGNPGTSWTAPTATTVPGFLSGSSCFMPPDADVRDGDRLQLGTVVYDVTEIPLVVRSPARAVVTHVKLRRRVDGES
jgi:hypothetical protein